MLKKVSDYLHLNISATRLKGFPEPKPHLIEHKKMANHAKALNRKLDVKRSKLDRLQELFYSLIYELIERENPHP